MRRLPHSLDLTNLSSLIPDTIDNEQDTNLDTRLQPSKDTRHESLRPSEANEIAVSFQEFEFGLVF